MRDDSTVTPRTAGRSPATGGRERGQLLGVLDPRRGLGAARRRRPRTGATAAIAAATLSAVRPPLRISGIFERRCATSSQSNVSPVPPRMPARAWASSRWKSVWKASSAWMSAWPRTAAALMTLRARAPRDLARRRPGPRRRAAGASSGRARRRPGDLVERRVDEHAAELERGGAAPRRCRPPRPGRTAAASRGHRIMPSAQAPRSTASWASSRAGDAADLDAGHPLGG